MNDTSTASGEVITFYSYKGGSGRSMALANVACLLAARKQRSRKNRVLVIDWDLEAPGLHRFFQPYLSRTEVEMDGQLGLIDLFVEVARRTAGIPASPEPPSSDSWLDGFDFGCYVMKSTIPGLDVMKAGRVGPEYSKTITTFDWAGLYASSPWIFSWFTNELTHRYRYTLIDSRTGETDTSSICTSIMPEKLVAVFTPNLQALQGVIRQIERAVRFRRSAADERPIKIFPVPSRIENARSALRDHWRFDEPIGFQPRFAQLFRDLFGLATCDLTAYFAKVQIPQMPDYAFGEPIAVLEEATQDRFTISGSYVDLQACLLDDEEIWEYVSTDSPARVLPDPPQKLGLEPKVFRIFISYANEDLPIATAIATCLKAALPDFFAEVNLDKWFLEPGLAFKKQIEAKLEQTDVLLIVSGVAQTQGSTGWEVGYFERLRATTPGHVTIRFYVASPPAVSAGEQGISLGLSRDMLALSYQQFESQLTVPGDEPLCVLLERWQEQVDQNIEKSGFSPPRRKPEQEPIKCVRDLKLAVFRYSKSTIEAIYKPQKQIVIGVRSSALGQAMQDLPPDAEIRPVSSGSAMAIFGLADEPITWERFLFTTQDNRLCDSWREAITGVVLSSFPDRINVDNSQIISSSDELKSYRVILTTATKYYDDYREFTLYFVETVNRADYGDQSTSALLRGLELVCRLRSLFLEMDSEFSALNVQATSFERLPQLASGLVRELNLFRKDSISARLDEPRAWRRFVPWDQIMALNTAYRPSENKIREIIARIAASRGSETALIPLQKDLAAVLEDLEIKLRPVTGILVREMARKLESTVENQ